MKTRASRAFSCYRIILASLIFSLIAPRLSAQVSVLTGNYDNFRTNSNLAETLLHPGSVRPGTFGRLYSLPVDGQVYAQPLVVSEVVIPGFGRRNLVLVATARNTIYAFDADPQGSHTPFWKTSLGTPVPTANYSVGGYYFDDLLPFNGILSTPVVDPSTLTLYAVAATLENGVYAYRLHALDLSTGQPRYPAVEIQGEVESSLSTDDSGLVRFDAFWHLQRPGLLLANGYVYIGFGSHGGVGPYHGWVFAYRADGLQRAAIFNVTPNRHGSGVWMSGRGIAADEHGSVYLSTGNGPFDGVSSFGVSVLKLDPNLALQSWFTPADHEELTAADNDLGACGPILIPGANVLAVGGKVGTLFVLSRGELGGLSPDNSAIVQQFQPVTASAYNLAVWPRPDGALLFVPGGWEPVKSYRLRKGRFEAEPASVATTGAAIPYFGMAVSSNGADAGSGILWTTSTEEGYSGRAWPGTLRAFLADRLDEELWNSDLDPEDRLPSYAKFTTPTVANGLVFVPTFSNQVVVFGLRTSGQEMERELRITNAFSRTGGAVSPGELLLIEGSGIGPDEPVFAPFPEADAALPRSLDGVQVLFDGEPAPLLEVSTAGILAVTPWSVLDRDSVLIEVTRAGVSSKPSFASVSTAHPGLKSFDASGIGRGDFFNEDGTPNRPGQPAPHGTLVSVQITGFGLTTLDNTGWILPGAPPPAPTLPVTASIGGVAAEVVSLAPIPGAAGAIFRLTLRVPADCFDGPRIPVIVRVGEATAPALTLSITPADI